MLGKRDSSCAGLACARESGQATVEAAFLIPVMLVGLLLLVQPGILLYDRMVMGAAAREACRLLVTKADVAGDMAESCEAFVKHRLGSIPPVDCFHVHQGGCTWGIELEGDEGSGAVRAAIRTEAKPLPLVAAAGTALGILNERGNFVVEVRAEQRCQPAWADQRGDAPGEWVGAWLG